MGKRIIAQRRGKGSVYEAPSHRYPAEAKYPNLAKTTAKVLDLVHSPLHTAPLAKVKLENGEVAYLLPPEFLAAKQTIKIGYPESALGNVVELKDIPEGTKIFNIEGKPGDGGKFVRAGGTYAVLVSKSAQYATVQLPSKRLRTFPARCRATIGVVAGGGRKDKPFGKAGKRFYAFRARAKAHIKVSGVAMNPVSHPHGGGGHQHVGKSSCVGRGTPPGRKAGSIRPKKTGRR